MAKFYMGFNEIPWADLISRYPSVFYSTGSYTRAIPGSSNRRLHLRSWGEGWIVTDNMKDEKDYGRVTKFNIKYVPKYLKEKDYPTFADWFKAVFRFVDDFYRNAVKWPPVRDSRRQPPDARPCGTVLRVVVFAFNNSLIGQNPFGCRRGNHRSK